MDPIILYAKDARNQLRYWQIEIVDCELIMEYGIVGGEPIYETEEVLEGKAGRDIDEQLMLRMNSRIKRKKDAGYLPSKEEAMTKKRTNALGFKRAMLAQKYEKCHAIVKDGEFAIQSKYDGFRCLITKQSGQLFAYTRGGELIATIDHILDELKNMPDGTTIDGELYRHGWTLQKISSCVKRHKALTDTLQIKLMAYDIIDELVYSERFALLSKYVMGLNNVILAHTLFDCHVCDIPTLLRSRRARGYEGLILRLDNKGYEDGKRSKSLIKVKAWEDDEFLIVGVKRSEKGRAVLECITHEGKGFDVVPPGTALEKEKAYCNQDWYIGRNVKVEFANYTKDGIPFQPVAQYYREKNDV